MTTQNEKWTVWNKEIKNRRSPSTDNNISWDSIPWDNMLNKLSDRAYFDRFDICEAYYLMEIHWNISGVLQERKSNQRRKMSTGYQLGRMGFSCRGNFSYATLSDNGKMIYDNLLDRYGFKEDHNG